VINTAAFQVQEQTITMSIEVVKGARSGEGRHDRRCMNVTAILRLVAADI
jgi:hypothetical protein